MARSAMSHRANIEQNTASTVDDYGNPVPPVWDTHSTMPCRAYTKVRKEDVDGDKTVLVEDLKALFSKASGISESYRIANITDRLGVVLFAGPLSIRTIQRRSNHLELSLDRIQS
ncbi:MAG: hypothetical protein ACREN0_08975 [Thermodesulfobacteriota bacterium]